MNERMYTHMRNTLKDIEGIANSGRSDGKKVSDIKLIIALLRSVEYKGLQKKSTT